VADVGYDHYLAEAKKGLKTRWSKNMRSKDTLTTILESPSTKRAINQRSL
jgi:hypothetical protein